MIRRVVQISLSHPDDKPVQCGETLEHLPEHHPMNLLRLRPHKVNVAVRVANLIPEYLHQPLREDDYIRKVIRLQAGLVYRFYPVADSVGHGVGPQTFFRAGRTDSFIQPVIGDGGVYRLEFIDHLCAVTISCQCGRVVELTLRKRFAGVMMDHIHNNRKLRIQAAPTGTT